MPHPFYQKGRVAISVSNGPRIQYGASIKVLPVAKNQPPTIDIQERGEKEAVQRVPHHVRVMPSKHGHWTTHMSDFFLSCLKLLFIFSGDFYLIKLCCHAVMLLFLAALTPSGEASNFNPEDSGSRPEQRPDISRPGLEAKRVQ